MTAPVDGGYTPDPPSKPKNGTAVERPTVTVEIVLDAPPTVRLWTYRCASGCGTAIQVRSGPWVRMLTYIEAMAGHSKICPGPPEAPTAGER